MFVVFSSSLCCVVVWHFNVWDLYIGINRKRERERGNAKSAQCFSCFLHHTPSLPTPYPASPSLASLGSYWWQGLLKEWPAMGGGAREQSERKRSRGGEPEEEKESVREGNNRRRKKRRRSLPTTRTRPTSFFFLNFMQNP